MVCSFSKLFRILRGGVGCHLYILRGEVWVGGVRERGVNKHKIPHIYHTNTHVKFAKLRGIKMASHYGKFNISWAICLDWNRHTSKIAYPHAHTRIHPHPHTCLLVCKYFPAHTHTDWHFATGFILHSRQPHKCGRSSQLPLLGRQPHPFHHPSILPSIHLPPLWQWFFTCFTHTILNSIKSLRIRQTCAAPRHADDDATPTRAASVRVHCMCNLLDTVNWVPGTAYLVPCTRHSQTQMTFVFSCH